MLIYGLQIAAILVIFDFINWIYYFFAKSLTDKNIVKFFGKGFFKGYLPIFTSSIIIIVVLLIKDKIQQYSNYDVISNVIVGIVFLSQIAYIFFIRPRLIMAGLGNKMGS